MCGGTLFTGDTLSDARDPGPAMPVPERVGAYRLFELIGEGGMGRVYRAEHVRLGRQVALKMLRPRYARNIDAIERFFAEARAIAAIDNDHIVRISDFIEDASGLNCYVMELLEGRTLRQIMDEDGPLPLPRAVALALQLCQALTAVHEAGILHRDVKPDNVFVCQDERGERVVLIDFGVAKLFDVDDRTLVSLERTAEGAILGTPEYMSPEQASGKRADYRSDVYALGIILFELVTGRKPFRASSFGDLVVQQLTNDPPRPSALARHALPRELDDLIMACIAREPEDRIDSAAELEHHLRALMGDSLDLATLLAAQRRASRRRLAGTLLTCAALILGVVSSVRAIGSGRAAPPPASVAVPALQAKTAKPPARVVMAAPDTVATARSSEADVAAQPGPDTAAPPAAEPPSRAAHTPKPRRERPRRHLELDRDAVMDPFPDQ